ncbi:amidohydrolase family protein [Shewanella salipaludis]|uniref:Amidohydrolase family protein n=1 Tax=Shewanella salipaludis TaxID=2723052 RepID=A0A972G1B0_9GAMM|nr:amidohydrolase family protein [Shewanella salipaludis]NMH65354.1 amidohydrolase family protein [Shewanella salipaludis]
MNNPFSNLRPLLLGAAVGLSLPVAAEVQHDLLLKNVSLVDVESGEIRQDKSVLIDKNRIVAILAQDKAASLQAARIEDLHGKFIIPALWDMHVHFEGRELIPDNALLLPLYLAYGITGVREAASDLAPEVLQWRAEIAAGQRLGPKIFTAGQKFEGLESIWSGDLEVGDRQAMLAGMDRLDAMKVDFIKITENTMDADLFLDTIKEAKRRGYLVSTHVPYGLSIEAMADAGLSSIEHASYVLRLGNKDEAKIAGAVRAGSLSTKAAAEQYAQGFDQLQAERGYRMLAAKGVAVTPTLIGGRQLAYLAETDHSQDDFLAYLTRGFVSKYQWRVDRMAGESEADKAKRKSQYRLLASQLPKLKAAGVTLLAGSDSAALNTYVYPAQALHQELVLFQQAGLSPLEALQAATVNGAKFMGQWQDYGSLAEGKMADILILNSNPLIDIHATQDIDSLIYQGRVLDRARLDALLASAAETRRQLDAAAR